LPNRKIDPDKSVKLESEPKDLFEQEYLTKKYGIRERRPKPTKGAAGSRKKKEIPAK
jgi:hypothetical protein